MKTILLAGGLGTRLSEETGVRPKPMVEVGGLPILVHIMSIYAARGFDEFVVACGYRGDYIKEYFANYTLKRSDWSINLRAGTSRVLRSDAPDWTLSLVDTGHNTMTGGRVRRLLPMVADGPFMVTYGDGVADLDVRRLVDFHRAHGKIATVTAVRPPARFGCLELDGDRVASFSEKPQTSEGWINGGFFVFEPAVADYLTDDTTVLEKDPLERLARDGQLMAFQHPGFWQPMDTLRDKQVLEKMWESGTAPWKVWSDADGSDEFLPLPPSAGHRTHRVQRHLAG